MNYKHFHHQDTFTDVWANLRQPSTAWVTRQLLSHLQDADQSMETLKKRLEKKNSGVSNFQ